MVEKGHPLYVNKHKTFFFSFIFLTTWLVAKLFQHNHINLEKQGNIFATFFVWYQSSFYLSHILFVQSKYYIQYIQSTCDFRYPIRYKMHVLFIFETKARKYLWFFFCAIFIVNPWDIIRFVQSKYISDL